MICSRHGLSGIVPVCPHVRDAVQKHQADLVIKDVRGPDFSDREMTWCKVCQECHLRFPEWKGVKDEEDEWFNRFDACWAEVGLVAMCGQCLRENVRSE